MKCKKKKVEKIDKPRGNEAPGENAAGEMEDETG